MIYELKTYKATEGNITALKKRFAENGLNISDRKQSRLLIAGII